jgi:hypothetical protein
MGNTASFTINYATPFVAVNKNEELMATSVPQVLVTPDVASFRPHEMTSSSLLPMLVPKPIKGTATSSIKDTKDVVCNSKVEEAVATFHPHGLTSSGLVKYYMSSH